MKNQVIKVLDVEHGKKVIEHFRNLGADANGFKGCNIGLYYGIINSGNRVSWASEQRIKEMAIEIIELPKEEPQFNPKRGDRVMASDNGEDWKGRIFLTEIKGVKHPIVVVSDYYEENYIKGQEFNINVYKFMKPTEKTTLTRQEIADKFGVNIEDLTIK